MNNGFQKSNGCGADKEGRKFFNQTSELRTLKKQTAS